MKALLLGLSFLLSSSAHASDESCGGLAIRFADMVNSDSALQAARQTALLRTKLKSVGPVDCKNLTVILQNSEEVLDQNIQLDNILVLEKVTSSNSTDVLMSQVQATYYIHSDGLSLDKVAVNYGFFQKF